MRMKTDSRTLRDIAHSTLEYCFYRNVELDGDRLFLFYAKRYLGMKAGRRFRSFNKAVAYTGRIRKRLGEERLRSIGIYYL